MEKFWSKFLNKKFLMTITIVFLTLGASAITAQAARCGFRTCGCSYTDDDWNTAINDKTCSGTTCWFSSPNDHCDGHDFPPGDGTPVGGSSATCTSGGTQTYKVTCTICHNSYPYNKTTGALGHAMSSWKDAGSYHYATCSRCGHQETDGGSHGWSSWVAHTGYRRKDCEHSGTGCGYHNCNNGDRNGCDAYREEWHYTTIYLNTNGGFWINGGGNEIRSIGQYKYNQRVTFSNNNRTAYRYGYKCNGWSQNSVTYSPVTNSSPESSLGALAQDLDPRLGVKQYDSAGNAVCRTDFSVTLYAQWERTIKYNIHYLDTNGNKQTDSFTIKYQNWETGNVVIGSFNNGATYNFTSNNSNTKTVSGGINVVNRYNQGTRNIYTQPSDSIVITYNDWTSEGWAKENGSVSATNKQKTAITSYLTETKSLTNTPFNAYSNSSETINYYTSYKRTSTMTYVLFGQNTQITTRENGTSKMRYNGNIEQMPTYTFKDFNSSTYGTMKYTEPLSSGATKTEDWKYDSWSLGFVDNETANGFKTIPQTAQEKIHTLINSADEKTINDTKWIANNSKITTYADRTYYADYTKTFTLQFNSNGGLIKLNIPQASVTNNALYDVIYTNNSTLSKITLTRHANAYANGSTKHPLTDRLPLDLPLVKYESTQNGKSIYRQGSWSYIQYTPNTDFYGTINNSINTNDTRLTGHNLENRAKANTAIFNFTPLVNETIYATWTNQSAQTNLEPKVNVEKTVKWCSPETHNLSEAFNKTEDGKSENLNLADVNGYIDVTLKVTITNPSSKAIGIDNLVITDYYDTEVYDWVDQLKWTCKKSGGNHHCGIDKGKVVDDNGEVTWTILSNDEQPINPGSTTTYVLTYQVQLEEEHWTIMPNGQELTDLNGTLYYLNPIKNLTKYNATIKDGKVDYSTNYYTTSEGLRSYVYATYTITNRGDQYTSGTKLENTTRYVPYPTGNTITMYPLFWRPETEQVQIWMRCDGCGYETHTWYNVCPSCKKQGLIKHNVFLDIDSKYSNTWYVQYDTHSTTDSSNSLFDITMNSWLKREYSFYQITDNLFDIRTLKNTEQVLDNYLGHNKYSTSSLTSCTNTANRKLYSNQYTPNEMFKVSSLLNIRSNRPYMGYNYTESKVDTRNTIFATDQDGLKMSIYPIVRTTDTRTGYTYLTTREQNENVNLKGLKLKDSRCDVTIDATNPIITEDKRIITPEEEPRWTYSDGYIDINLVNGITDPVPQVHELTFKFQDLVSGVNYPGLQNDWITRINDNVQVVLTNTDTGKVIFSYARDQYDITQHHPIINVGYTITGAMNNGKDSGGTIKLTLDPSNDDLLGHLKLEIKIIDNVGNWEKKTYDIYSFCLTGEVNVVDTLPNSDDRDPAEIWRGEQGKVGVQADGWVDRVTLDYEQHLVKATEDDVHQRNDIFGDDYKINGDYPVDNSNLTASQALVPYLPKSYQKCRWGFADGTLGGLPLTLAELTKVQDVYVNNDLLNEHLSELVDNFIILQDYGIPDDIFNSDYAIVGTTLYTYPIYNNGEIKSYLHSYELEGLIELDGVSHPVNVIIDGSHYAAINYTRVYKPNPETGTMQEYIVPKIEEQTLFASEWVQSGGAYLRPFYHYFYMPKNAELRGDMSKGDNFIVQITAYKDSDKDFVHSVTIELRFTNGEWTGNKLQTNIKDN